MTPMDRQQGERLLLRIGAVAAIIGTILQVAAGSSQSALIGAGAGSALADLAAQPDWLWPLSYAGFIFGSLLWVAAIVALASRLTGGTAWALIRLAIPAVIVGVTLHAVDGSLNAVGLTGLARAWATAPAAEQATLVDQSELLLLLLDGTWAGVITLYHGLPFILVGLAVVVSQRFPAWLGWIGVLGGAGSLVIGVAKLFGTQTFLEVPFAVVLSLFMVILGWLLWIEASRDVAAPADSPAAAQGGRPQSGVEPSA